MGSDEQKYIYIATLIKLPKEIEILVDTKSILSKIIEDIAQTGDISAYDWKSIKLYIALKMKEAILNMNIIYPDFQVSSNIGETFEDTLTNILLYYKTFEDK